MFVDAPHPCNCQLRALRSLHSNPRALWPLYVYFTLLPDHHLSRSSSP
jgi:hypothetical protein